MYNIKINTLPVLTKLIYKLINAQGEIKLTSKEDTHLKKEIEKNEGKLVAISFYHKGYKQYMSYIGSLTYELLGQNQEYYIPVLYACNPSAETMKIVYYVTYQSDTKTLSFCEI